MPGMGPGGGGGSWPGGRNGIMTFAGLGNLTDRLRGQYNLDIFSRAQELDLP